jgi:predicted nucleic-acid-binding protein
MIGIDSNFLVRIFAHDNAAQRSRSIKLIEGLGENERCYVNWIVIAELILTLRKAYGFDGQQLATVARSLIWLINQAQGARMTYTFDHGAIRNVGMALVPE